MQYVSVLPTTKGQGDSTPAAMNRATATLMAARTAEMHAETRHAPNFSLKRRFSTNRCKKIWLKAAGTMDNETSFVVRPYRRTKMTNDEEMHAKMATPLTNIIKLTARALRDRGCCADCPASFSTTAVCASATSATFFEPAKTILARSQTAMPRQGSAETMQASVHRDGPSRPPTTAPARMPTWIEAATRPMRVGRLVSSESCVIHAMARPCGAQSPAPIRMRQSARGVLGKPVAAKSTVSRIMTTVSVGFMPHFWEMDPMAGRPTMTAPYCAATMMPTQRRLNSLRCSQKGSSGPRMPKPK
mmetsp:Transcript_9058/g.31187  ORF Transcript_9058/g.31187 Transcript_9058/m.31187 type:complete len:302 (+) Transcript_9058:1434-2339(+)